MTDFDWTSEDLERTRRYLCGEMNGDERAEFVREIRSGKGRIAEEARRLAEEDASLIIAIERLAAAAPRTKVSVDARHAISRRKAAFVLAAALAAVLLGVAVWLGHPSRELVVALKDPRHIVGVTADGSVVGLVPYSPEVQDGIRVVLQGQLPFPGREDYLGYRPPIAVRSNGNVEIPLVAPINTVVLSQRPLFKWEGVEGVERYIVSLTTLSGNTLESPSIQGDQWQIGVPLERGATYDWWVVPAENATTDNVLPGRFRVATEPEATQAEEVRAHSGDSPLTLLIVYSRLGMFNLAEKQLGRLAEANPDSELLNRLKRVLASHREAPREGSVPQEP